MADEKNGVSCFVMDQMCLNLMRKKPVSKVDIKNSPLQNNIDLNKNLSKNNDKNSSKK